VFLATLAETKLSKLRMKNYTYLVFIRISTWETHNSNHVKMCSEALQDGGCFNGLNFKG
jgi:hypothetical protein